MSVYVRRGLLKNRSMRIAKFSVLDMGRMHYLLSSGARVGNLLRSYPSSS